MAFEAIPNTPGSQHVVNRVMFVTCHDGQGETFMGFVLSDESSPQPTTNQQPITSQTKMLEIRIQLLPSRAANGFTQVLRMALKKICPFAKHIDVSSSMIGIHIERRFLLSSTLPLWWCHSWTGWRAIWGGAKGLCQLDTGTELHPVRVVAAAWMEGLGQVRQVASVFPGSGLFSSNWTELGL